MCMCLYTSSSTWSGWPQCIQDLTGVSGVPNLETQEDVVLGQLNGARKAFRCHLESLSKSAKELIDGLALDVNTNAVAPDPVLYLLWDARLFVKGRLDGLDHSPAFLGSTSQRVATGLQGA